MLTKLIFPEALPTWALFAELFAAGLVVILAGGRFARLADTLANRLHLGGGWVGLVLLATVTSLPELVSGGTATAIGNVDLALGGIFGSCCFNITLIVLLNALWGGGSVLRGGGVAHMLSSSFGLLLLGLALLGIVVQNKFSHQPAVARMCEIGWAGLIGITYLGCIRLIYRNEHPSTLEKDTSVARRDAPEGGSASLYGWIAAIGVVIVVASWWLAQLTDTLSTHPIEMIGRPLGATFVGVLFLAIATSLPEIATSISAVRLGNLDLALGNIFGSNMFNIFILPALKVISMVNGDPVLLGHSPSGRTQSLIAGLLAMLLTAIAVAGLAYKSRRKILRRFGFDSILIAITYVGGMYLLLLNGK